MNTPLLNELVGDPAEAARAARERTLKDVALASPLRLLRAASAAARVRVVLASGAMLTVSD